ncbi:DUF3108 domain-containing protein [Noviherbaspirillum sp.]|uniref:DUF3108 domain-containing protein n=1 Tax=Noviherbaspirillum sp. TaxID=1926288 RepID=UPI002FE3112E
MNFISLPHGILLLVASTLMHGAVAQPDPANYKVSLPPSAELMYHINAKQRGITVDGDATVRWMHEGKKFAVSSEVRAMVVGKILESRSEGQVDNHGLVPEMFTEKRLRKDKITTSFDRDAGLIRFSKSQDTQPIVGGEQDRTSAVWQLVAIARAANTRIKPGIEWRFVVAGQSDAEPWTFKVVTQEKISTQAGELDTIHISRAPRPDSRDQQLDIWLAPALEWYPVRLRFSDDNGDFIEQTLKKANRSAS